MHPNVAHWKMRNPNELCGFEYRHSAVVRQMLERLALRSTHSSHFSSISLNRFKYFPNDSFGSIVVLFLPVRSVISFMNSGIPQFVVHDDEFGCWSFFLLM